MFEVYSTEEESISSLRERNSSVKPSEPNCCTVFTALLKMCGLCCYIGCPPLPESIARKLAFHPPKKGTSYTVHSVAHPERRINGADELVAQDFFIVPTSLEFTTDFDYERMLSRVKVSSHLEEKVFILVLTGRISTSSGIAFRHLERSLSSSFDNSNEQSELQKGRPFRSGQVWCVEQSADRKCAAYKCATMFC